MKLFKKVSNYNLKTILKMIVLGLVATIPTFFIIGCDKGTDSVDFVHYLDANDRRVVHFNAKGKSDYGNFEYEWSFGDGSTGQGKDITHKFSDFGKFTVILTATITDSNIETTVVKEIEVEIPQITNLNFEVLPDKKDPRLYSFSATSETDYGSVEYEWDFGDGIKTTGDNVQYGFDYYGLYNISVKAKIAEYEKISSIAKKNVEISAPAITRLDIYAEQDDDNPFMYHFKPIAETSWGTLEYEWSFGDGKIALDEEPINTYSKYNSYIVKVKARIKETGAERTETKEITVQKPIFKNYNITHTIDPNDPLNVSFTIENTDGETEEDMSQQDSFRWEFGDGETAGGLRVQHRYESYGEKTVYVTLVTPDQTQKTLIKNLTLESPAIKDIKITGQPSMKAGNLIEYRVTAESEFEDEIEYEWEFEDGTRKNGRAVQREMSFWPNADSSGKITENIYLRVKIPRLNVSIRNTEPYKVQVLRPKIINLAIKTEQTGTDAREFTTSLITSDGKRPQVLNGGGDIEYEWVFNGQTYIGANQRITVPTTNTSYPLLVTAKIEDTNITAVATTTLEANDNISFICSTQQLDSNHENALTISCYPITGGNIAHSGIKTRWDFGDGKLPKNADEKEVTYKYDKAGIYNITMTFSSNQSKPISIEKKFGVLVDLKFESTYEKDEKGSKSCSGGYLAEYKIKRTLANNFDKFKQEDFTINASFTSGSFKCKGISDGWNRDITAWEDFGNPPNYYFGNPFGDWEQWGTVNICLKEQPENLTQEQICLKKSF